MKFRATLIASFYLLLATLAGAQNTSTYGNVTAGAATCTPTSCVYYQLPANTPWVVVSVTGTWSGTLQVQAITSQSTDYSYASLNKAPWTLAATMTGNGGLSVATAGATFILVQAPTWASGKAVVTMTASDTGAPLSNPAFLGGMTSVGVTAPNGGSSANCWLTNGTSAPCGGANGTWAGITGGTQTGSGTGQVNILPGALNAPAVNSVYNAAAYSGSDCGAKINNADTQLLGVPAEIDVNQACGTTWTTPIVLTANHNLKFTQGGTYTLPTGNIVKGYNLVSGIGPQATLKLPAGAASSMFFTADGWKTLTGTNAATNVVFDGFTIDGNQANPASTCTSSTYNCGRAIYLNSTSTQAPSNIEIKNVTFQNFYADPILIETGTAAWSSGTSGWPEASFVNIHNNTFNNSVKNHIRVYSFASHMKIENNLFQNWDSLGSGSYDAISWADVDNGISSCTSSSPKWTSDWKINGNRFLYPSQSTSTSNMLLFAVEMYGGPGNLPCAQTDGFEYTNNLHDAAGKNGGTGLSVDLIHAVISNNRWLNGAQYGDRNGVEGSMSNAVVEGNYIYGGTLQIGISGRNPTENGNIAIGSNVVINPAQGAAGAAALTINGGSNVSVVGGIYDVSGAVGGSNVNAIMINNTYWSVSNLTIKDTQLFFCSTCIGIRLSTATGLQSTGIDIAGNWIHGSGSLYGILDSNTDARDTDLRIHDNHIDGAASPITVLLNSSAVWAQWGNITSATSTMQQLNGGAAVDITGLGAFPGGVAPALLSAPPSTNLVAWYDASAACTAAGTLANWPDSSGAGFTLAGTTTNGACVLNAVNGHAAVLFNGTQTGYRGTFGGAGYYSSTVFITFQKTVGNHASSVLFDGNYSNCNYCLFFTTATNLELKVPSLNLDTSLSDTGAYHVATVTFTSSGTATVWIDGVQAATGTPGDFALAGLDLGARKDGFLPFYGSIAEVEVYGASLNTSQLQAVGSYLGAKYGLIQAGAWSVIGGKAQFGTSVTTPVINLNGGTPLTSQSSANPQVVTCPAGGTTTQYCSAAGSWTTPAAAIPVRAGTWSISSATSVAVTFATPMSTAPTSCSVPPSSSSAATGQPFSTALSTSGFTVNVPTSGTIAGTYNCISNNAN